MPDIRVVSEQSELDIQRNRAEEQLSWPLRDLAANLLRVIRGAGKPHELLSQMTEFVSAALEFEKVHGHMPPSWTISKILQLPDEVENLHERARRADGITQADIDRWYADGTFERKMAVQHICRGVLQKSASALIGQSTQERAGDREMYDGIFAIEELRRSKQKARRRS